MIGAAWQRCRVHFLRNVLAKVSKGHAEMVAAAIRTVFAQPDAMAVADQLDSIAGKLGRQFPAVETMLRDAEADLCAFAAFPQAHWRKIWSTNPLERVNKEIKRRTNVVGIFLRVPLSSAISAWAVIAARLHEGPRVTRNLSVEPPALTSLGPVPSVPRWWPSDPIAA